jgi:hypothetical protein
MIATTKTQPAAGRGCSAAPTDAMVANAVADGSLSDVLSRESNVQPIVVSQQPRGLLLLLLSLLLIT